LVSDRARALVKLAKREYLSTFSMPDLFHFMQDFGKTVGARLGSQVVKAQKAISGIDCKSESYEDLKKNLVRKTALQTQYKQARQEINKLIHPFDEFDQLISLDKVDTGLRHLFNEIKVLAALLNSTNRPT